MQNYWNLYLACKHYNNSLTGPLIIGTFEKRAQAPHWRKKISASELSREVVCGAWSQASNLTSVITYAHSYHLFKRGHDKGSSFFNGQISNNPISYRLQTQLLCKKQIKQFKSQSKGQRSILTPINDWIRMRLIHYPFSHRVSCRIFGKNDVDTVEQWKAERPKRTIRWTGDRPTKLWMRKNAWKVQCAE